MKNEAQRTNPLTESEYVKLVNQGHRDWIMYARALTRNEQMSLDITQDALIVAWNQRSKYDRKKSFFTWVRGIIRNKWRESLRRNTRLVLLETNTLDLLEMQMQEWEVLNDEGGVFELLEGCLKKLPEKLKSAIQFYYYKGHSSDDSASKLEVNSTTFRKRLERARQQLRECVQRVKV